MRCYNVVNQKKKRFKERRQNLNHAKREEREEKEEIKKTGYEITGHMPEQET